MAVVGYSIAGQCCDHSLGGLSVMCLRSAGLHYDQRVLCEQHQQQFVAFTCQVKESWQRLLRCRHCYFYRSREEFIALGTTEGMKQTNSSVFILHYTL